MPIPHVFLPVKPQDFNIKPFKVHKRYVVADTDYSSSGYTVQQAVYTSLKTPISASKAQNDPRNIDKSYQHIIWQSLNHRYYRDAYDPTKTFEHFNKRYTYKHLGLSASLWSAPYLDYGDGIKPGSVQITGSSHAATVNFDFQVFNDATVNPQRTTQIDLRSGNTIGLKVGDTIEMLSAGALTGTYKISHLQDPDLIDFVRENLDGTSGFSPGGIDVTITSPIIRLNDDGYGNIYDSAIITSSYADRNRLVAYWGFNEQYKVTKYGYGSKPKTNVKFKSNTFEPDITSLAKNVTWSAGIEDDALRRTGIQADFFGNSCIATHNKQDWNFDKAQDFTISFWVRAPISQSVTTHTTNTLISKRGTIRNTKWGKNPKLSANNVLIPTHYMSQSIENELTNVYPYHFEINNQTAGGHPTNGLVTFKRSDGSKIVSLATTQSGIFQINNNRPSGSVYNHIAVTKSGSLLSLYMNGVLHETGSDVGTEPINNHMLIFGSDNIDFARGFSGSLDEIRFYNYAAPQSSIQTLADFSASMYQTSVVGNVFYKNGTIVISSLLPKYDNVISGSNWSVTYRNTHTIYENECLVRVKAGDANMSTNPTALQSAHSDMYINDMTSSLLKPYVTSIGLYNAKGELLAVGKLGQPVAIRDDVNTNFIVRWDM